MSLQNVDIGIVVLYLVGVLAFGIWIGRREKADRQGFFLGGRNFSWLLIGTSLFATNISSVQFVGQSGLAYKIGIAAANPQLTGVICLAFSAVFFIPIYLRTRIFTIPGFLESRYGRQAKLIYAVTLVFFGLCLSSIILYSGSLVALQLFGLGNDMIFYCALALGLATGIYAVTGGLSSVVYTDLVQSLVLLIGGVLVLFLGLAAAGGLSGLVESVPPQHLEMTLPADHEVMPFTAVLSGLLLISIFWATSNQDLLQRTLGAKDLRNAQLGMLLGGALKIVAVFVLVFPGILAFKLVPGIDPDRAYPALIQEVLPIGFSGIVLAGFIAAIMSTLDSSIMSMSSVFANDIYPALRPRVSEERALRVGRIAAMTILVWAICTAALVQHLGLIYLLMQKILSYLLPAVGVCYMVGRFSRRANGFGAVVTMGTGFVFGLYILLFTTIPALAPYCPDVILEANFYHVTFFLVAIYTATLLVASRFRPAPDAGALAFLTATEEEIAAHRAAMAKAGVLGSFRFWVSIYVCAFVAIFLVF